MKKFTSILKVRPEDFVVEEILDLPPLGDKGPFSYYRLKKRNINTLNAIDLIQKYWKIPRSRIGFCGLKDKRAVTVQYLSIEDGPEKNLQLPNFTLEYLGKTEKPLSLGDAKGNLFTITLRSVNPKIIVKRLEIIKDIGFANYFGEQRFAPDLYMKKPFVKIALEKGLEEALKEYFCQHPSRGSLLKRLWGKWEEFFKRAAHLSPIEKRVLLTYIKKGDAEKAFRVFPKHLKLLFLFSYQSLLWNRVLANFLRKYSNYYEVEFVRKEKIAFYKELNPLLKEYIDLQLPFISEEVFEWKGPEEFKREILRVIQQENLEALFNKEIADLKIFNPGARKIIVFPENLKILEIDKSRVRFKFFLPSGSYATIFMLKLLTYPIKN